LFIDTATLADRWDSSRQTAAKVARLNKIRFFKTGKAQNAGLKFFFPDVLKFEGIA